MSIKYHIMDEETADIKWDGKFNYATIDCLPLELLMKICSFLDARFVIQVLSKVSQSFHDVLSVDSYWKGRVKTRWPKVYPAIPRDEEDFNWKQACIEREDQFTQWSHQEATTLTFLYDYDLFASVDCVHLMKSGEMVVSGSRDRFLNVLDVTKMTDDTIADTRVAKIHTVANAHKGWIWCLGSDSEDCVYTGSWDKYIKQWDLLAGCVEANTYRCKSAVLDLTIQPNLIVAASYAKLVYMIDPRTDTMEEYTWHTKPVLSLAVTDDVIISCSEDSTISFYDRRAAAVSNVINLKTYGICMSLSGNDLWVGDKAGRVSLIDARPTVRDIVDTYDLGHTEKVTGIQHTLGCLYTCSTDATLQVHEPSQNPAVISTTKMDGQLASLHYLNGVLATAGPNISIGVIKPRDLDT